MSRLIVGWTDNAFLANVVIAEAEGTDVGNFKTDDQGVVSLNWANFALGGFSVQAPATRLDMIAEFTAVIAAHEFAHLAGCLHTDFSPTESFAGTRTVMDKGFEAPLGPDLTFGTADDVTLQLMADLYHRDEGFSGLHDTLNTVSFGLSTGKGTGGQLTQTASSSTGTGPQSGGASWEGGVSNLVFAPVSVSTTSQVRAENELSLSGVPVDAPTMMYAPPDPIDAVAEFGTGRSRRWAGR
jgi:hypothetical protein